MYPDHSLMPKEAVRLAALAHLAERPMSYGDLATAVRGFIARIMGPSLELMGASIELLRYEGFVTSADGVANDDTRLLTLTDAGRAEFHTLLTASVRAPYNDLNRLVVALKMRFMHLLQSDERRAQADILTAASETELARLQDLASESQKDLASEGQTGEQPFAAWLAQEIALVETRLSWLREFRAGL